jgi:hypothetical protein
MAKAKVTIVFEYDTEDLTFMMGESVTAENFREVIEDRFYEDFLHAYNEGGLDGLGTIEFTEMETEQDVLYPNVKVKLVGEDGNAFAIMARVGSALKKAGVSQEEISQYYAESKSGDYDHLLRTAMKWVTTA